MNKINKTRHVVYNIKYHIIFVTKYRKKVITTDIKKSIIKVFNNLSTKLGLSIIEINGEEDHIHFILSVRPTSFNISMLVNIFKSSSSRVIRNEYPDILKIYYGENVKFWSRSYFVASVGDVSLKTLIHYIENQDKKTDSSTTCRG